MYQDQTKVQKKIAGENEICNESNVKTKKILGISLILSFVLRLIRKMNH